MGPVTKALALIRGLLLISFLGDEAFAFTFTPSTGRTHTLAATVDTHGFSSSSSGSRVPAARPALLRAPDSTSPFRWGPATAAPHGGASRGSRSSSTTTWRRSARGRDNGDEERPYIPGSGLRGVDTSNLTGSDKRDAEWFQRTAEREARGQLLWFEDPVTYIALFALVPVVIGFWGVLNCYIPGFCAPK